MNGITIIEEHFCRQMSLPAVIFGGCTMTVMCISLLSLCGFMVKTLAATKIEKILYWLLSKFTIVACIAFWFFCINAYNTTHIEYTVILDDTVNFNEFYERYEVISENNDEYRIKER